MPRILIFAIIFFSLSSTTAQNNLIELKIQLENAKKADRIEILSSMSKIYITDSLDKAIECAEEALKLSRFRKIDTQTELQLYQILGEAYYHKMDYKKALLYYDKEFNTIKNPKIDKETMDSYFNIALISQRLKKNKKADEYYSKSLEIALHLEDYNAILSNYLGLTEVNSDLGQHEKALNCFQSYINLRDRKIKKDVSQQMKILNGKYKSITEENKEKEKLLEKTKASLEKAEKKEISLVEDTLKKATEIKTITQDILLKEEIINEKEKVIKMRDRLLNLFVVFLSVIILFMIVVFYLYRLKKKANRMLTQSNLQISEQKDKISEQNKEIKDSIFYALRIQNALLPPSDKICSQLQDHFIFFKPRDIVSGDFYWTGQVDEKTIIVAADCTGHGVPGAFMSMLGVAFLTEIVEKQKITKPDQILNKMRVQIVNSLQQEKGESADGMDMAIVCIDRKQNILEFSGANNPLYLIRNNNENTPLNHTATNGKISYTEKENNKYLKKFTSENYKFIQLNGDKMPVGIHENMPNFTHHQINTTKGDTIYIFSDGFADQFGGPNQKKLKYRAFRDLLLKYQHKSMQEQKAELTDFLNNWQGILEQVDDILIIGIRY